MVRWEPLLLRVATRGDYFGLYGAMLKQGDSEAGGFDENINLAMHGIEAP